MANVASVVANILIKASTEGVEPATASLKGLAAAQDNVAVVSESSAKRQTSATAAYNKQSIALDSVIKSMDRTAKATSVADRALQQGLITQAEHAARLELINQKYGVVTEGSSKFGAALKAANDNLAGFSGQLGATGSILSALGPAGLAAAAAIGILAFAFKGAAESALKLADEAGKLGDTADTIGTTVENLRALQLIGGEVGVESEKLTTGLEKFSGILGQVRDGAKGATDSFNNLSPGLADNVRNAKTFDEALQLVFTGLKNADTAAASLAARELFGKGGAGFARIAGAVEDVTKLGSTLNKLDVITTTQAKTWDQLGDSIARNMKLASQNVTASFAEPVLKVLDDVSKIVVELSRTFRLLAEPIAAGFATDALDNFRAEIQTLNFEIQNFGTGVAVGDLSERLFGKDATDSARTFITVLNSIGEILNQINVLAGSAGASLNAMFRLNAGDLTAALERAKGAIAEIRSSAGAAFSALSGSASNATTAVQSNTQATATNAKEWFKFGNQMEAVGGIIPTLDALPPKFGKAGAAAGDSGKKALDWIDIMKANVSALGGAATAAEKYQLQVAELAKKLQEGTISQDTFNRAVAHLEPNMVALRGVVGDLGSALSQAFINGQNKAEALNNSLKSIAATASSKAITSLLSGDFATAGLQGLIGVGAGLLSSFFGGGNKDDQKAQQDAAAKAEQARLEREKIIADAQIRAADYSLRAANAMEKSGFIVAIRNFDAESQKAFDEESKRAGDLAIWQLVAARAAERTKLIADTIEEATNTLAGNQLSDVQQRLKDVQAAAETLGNALLETGMSAEDAAAAVADKLNVALDQLRSKFVDDLVRKVNELSGGSWINDLSDLLTQVAQLRQDAGSLHVDPGLIDTFTVLSAQKIVDSAKLTGDAFAAVQRSLGGLGSQIHEFSDTVESAAAAVSRSIQEIANTIQSNEDRLFNAVHRSDSIDDQLARFDLQAQREREAEVAAGGEAIVSLEAAQQQERLNIITDYNTQQLQAQQAAQQQAAQAAQQARDAELRAEQQAAEERQRVVDEATKFLTNALRNISDFISHFNAGSSSPLSPAARLSSAQSTFSTQYGAATGGNRDALSGITGNAQDVIDAARAYYGSGAAGQSIIQGIISQLQTLPEQVSPEQFIVDNLSDALDTTASTISDSVSTMSDVLSSVLQTGNPSSIAAALSTYFNAIDTNTDGLLTQAELSSALGGTFPGGTFAAIDANGDGMISRQEIANSSLTGIKGGTDNLPAVSTNTGSIDTKSNRLGFIDNSTAGTATSTSNTAVSTANAATSLLALAQISGNTQSTAATLGNSDSLLGFIRSNLATQNNNWGTSGYTIPGGSPNAAIQGFAGGGFVEGPGTGTSDSILARLSTGEGIITAARVASMGGKSWVDSVNAGGTGANDNLLRRLIVAEIGGAQAIVQELRALRADAQENSKIIKRDRWRKAA